MFVWLSLGVRPRLSLFSALHHLPIYDSMRYSERFRLIWLLVVCLFAGYGLQWVRGPYRGGGFSGRRYAVIVVSAVLALVARSTSTP